MNHNQFKKIALISMIFYCIYFVAILFHSNLFCNILSPLLAFFNFGVVFYNSLSLKWNKQKTSKIIWLCLSFACLSWAFADSLWAIYDIFLGVDPKESMFITYFYTITNIFIFIAIITFCISLLKKWNGFQLMLDSITVAISTALLLWIIFFRKSIFMFYIIINKGGYSSLLSISLSMLILIGIAIWYLSLRKSKIPKFLNILVIGLIIFVISDLLYYYIYFYSQYEPNAWLDATYMLGLQFIALAAVLENYTRNKGSFDSNFGSNIGIVIRGLILLICPLVVYLFKGFVLSDMLTFLLIILLREIFGIYIQASINNEELLVKEKEMNIILEEKIYKRTKEIEDKNKELKEKNKELDFLSNQDTVTNLYNRRFFIYALEKGVKAINPTEKVGLIFLDLDRFKTINDMYGHQVGDQVLIEISKRLLIFQNTNCIIARLGGDEFVLGCHGDLNYEQLEEVATKILVKCSEPIEVAQYVFYITASIGISIYPLDAIDEETLLKNADIAMYQAKALGKGQCLSFNTTLKDNVNRKNRIEILLNKAKNTEFELFYQPQFRISDNKLIGAEALLRWTNSYLGVVSPAEFIPIAEEINLIYEIGNWVTTTAIHQIGIWNDTYDAELKVGINVSPKQLDHKAFIPNLKKIMKDNSVSSKNIDIEITENVAIEGEHRMTQIDSLFSGLGVSISIDDFGTGYSSLSYLKYFPFDRIKIAKQLVDTIYLDNYDLQIVKSIILLAKSIGIKTIAEGVELQEQYDLLKDIGCDEIQGYLLGKPVPAKQFEELFF